MRILGKIGVVVLVVLLSLFTAPSRADIISLKLRSDNRPLIKFSAFNYTHSGHVSVMISSVSVTSKLSQPDRSRIGFFLLSEEVLFRHPPESTSFDCNLDFKLLSVVFTLQDVSGDSFNKSSYPVTYPGLNYLYFFNCNRETVVTMDVLTEHYNIHGTTKDYLSAELTHLPSLYFIFSLVYLCFLGFWILVLFKNQRCFHTMHLVMGVLLVMTSVHYICAAVDLHYVKVTGTPHGWDAYFDTFQLIKTVLFFTVIMLISMGWWFRKLFLQLKEEEIFVLLVVIALQIMWNIASMKAGKTSHYPEDWFEWEVAIYLLDYSSCAIMFVPMHWSFISLRETYQTDRNAAKDLAKLCVFWKVYLGYVLFTRIVVVICLGPLVIDKWPWVIDAAKENKWPWVIDAAKETGYLVFCIVMFYIYRPFEKNVVGDEELGL